MYRKDLRDDLVAYPARVAADVRLACDAHTLARLAALRDGGAAEAALFARRVQRGQKCFVAWVGDEPAGFNWLAVADEDDEDRTVRLREGEVYCFDAFTAPRWRGHALHTGLLAHLLEHARDAGYRTAYTQVGSAGRASRKTHERLRWTVSGRLLFCPVPLGRPPALLVLHGSAHPIVRMWR